MSSTQQSFVSSDAQNTSAPLGQLGVPKRAAQPGPQTFSSAHTGIDEMTRIFNTALVSTQAAAPRNFSAELCEMMESPAFHVILNAVRQYARLHGLPEKQAAEQVIKTFRKLDSIWSDYLLQEGIERVKSSG